MRKIEKQMLNAVKNKAIRFISGNTWVSGHGGTSQVFLHNNHIATFQHDTGKLAVNTYTLRQWPTATTKSRLRALGAQVETRNGVVYLNGETL